MSTQIVTAPERRPITRDELVQIADHIRARHRHATEDIIKTGHDLIRVKSGLGHGRFLEWIETEFGMTDRTARRYMLAAEYTEGKSDTMSVLPLATIYALASSSTPKLIEERVVADLEAGKKVNHHQIEEEIKEEKRQINATEHAARREQSLCRQQLCRGQCLWKLLANFQKLARQRKREQELAKWEREEAKAQAHEKRVQEAVQEACAILLTLDTSELDRLLELLNADHGWGWSRLPEALAMRRAGA